jgi:parallel beta-helix repeat protein
MNAEQARRVLGLRSDEDWTEHESSFEAARQQMADLVRQSPTEAMAQRYQEGLMEFDRALAFFREQRAEAEECVATPVETPMVFEEPDVLPIRKSRAGMKLLVVIAMVAGAMYGLQEWQTRQEAERQMQVARWETEAADHLSKRRWQDALEMYHKIEEAEGNDAIATRGRRSIEAGMREEQEQYLGYWSGEAISAVEASRWQDASAAIARVLERDPRHEEMIALSEKVRMMRSENQRKQWQESAQQAMDRRAWETALLWIEKMLLAEPSSETALAWKASVLESQRIERENKEQASALYQQALANDKGVFDEPLLQVISRAKQLAPQDEAIGALYQKIAAYGRTIRVPQEMTELQKAFDSARDGDRVVIEAGTYAGSFTIKSALILEVAATGVVFRSPAEIGPALLLTREAQGAKISGVMFQHSDLLADAERFSAVLVNGADVSFDGCQFARAAGHGLAVIGGGRATIRQCRFEENGWDGLAVQDAQSRVVVRESFFVENIRHGIQLWNRSAGVLENNRFSQNCLNGIYVDTDAAVELRNNQVQGNREYGIVLKAAGGGEVSGNRFTENLLGGMVIGAEAKNAACRKNIFGKNGGHALSLAAGLSASGYAENQFDHSAARSILENVPMN